MLSRHEGLHNGGGTVSAQPLGFKWGAVTVLNGRLRETEDYKLLARAWQAASKKAARAGVDHLGPACPGLLFAQLRGGREA
jgi:hypothetical protein